MDETELSFEATPGKGRVSALLVRPRGATWLMLLAHAASTNIRHASMTAIVEALNAEGIATFRYQFPYMEKGGGGIDRPPVCDATLRSAVAAAKKAVPGLPLLAGGRSFGGRMTSMAAAREPLDGVRGIVFYGFPLHNAGQPSTERAGHLFDVKVPMLFFTGTRDDLADLSLLKPIVKKLGEKATLEVIDTADHSFKVQKKSGMTAEEAQARMAKRVRAWVEEL